MQTLTSNILLQYSERPAASRKPWTNTDELYQIWRETDRELGDFEAYKTQIAELGEAYNKMKGIKNKPDFIEVYNCVNDIVSCFECQKK